MLKIEGYELIEKLAAGGMAVVWKARQLSLDRMVAVKVLDKSSLPDESTIGRFREEARTAARLNHPNIVQVIDTGETGGQAYLVMEYVNGLTVGDLISLHGSIAEDRALEIAAKVADALAYAWEKECLIHCDINPNNILIEEGTGHVKLTDLGISRLIGRQGSAGEETDLIVGTPNYTSPEQSAGIDDLDCRSDMYSLGATLYHMMTGQLPFYDAKGSAAMTRHEEDFLSDPQEVNPEISGPAAWLIEKLMIKDRALRPMYWTVVQQDFKRVKAGQMPTAPLPEEGVSTVLRREGRSASAPGGKKKNGAEGGKPAVKLTVRKSAAREQAPAVSSLETEPSPTGSAFRRFILMLFTAGTVYAGFYFYGRIKGPPEPVEIPEPEIVVDVAEPVIPEPAEPEPAADTAWRNEDFNAGARLFNRALADYTEYQKTRTNPDVLKSVEKNCREAIAHFENARDNAPGSVNIDQYINQCYGMIANVRQSTLMHTAEENMKKEEGTAGAPSRPAARNPQPERRRVVFVDDEPAPAAVDEPAEPAEPPTLLRLSLEPDWNQPSASGSYGEELARLLARHASPSSVAEIDTSLVLFPGITCMMKARDAAEALEQEMPVPRPVESPGVLNGSLIAYTFEGDFFGARELSLVCDRNDRVVMTQLRDNRPAAAKLSPALFSPNWSVYDYVGGQVRGETDGLIAHQVRRRNGLIRIDTELAAASADAAGTPMSASRVVLIMPERLAGMILQINGIP